MEKKVNFSVKSLITNYEFQFINIKGVVGEGRFVMKFVRNLVPLLSAVLIAMPSTQPGYSIGNQKGLKQQDPCAKLRLPVTEELLSGKIKKIDRQELSNGWQSCSVVGENPKARSIIASFSSSRTSSNSLSAQFCNKYQEAKKLGFWPDSVKWESGLGLRAFHAAESGLYIYTGNSMFTVYVTAPEPARSQQVEAEGVPLSDKQASKKLATAILRNTPVNNNAPRPQCR